MQETPRWRLTASHYLNVAEMPDGTKVEWEHKETSRENGRTIKKLMPVPLYLNPDDSADCNSEYGIFVAHAGEGSRNVYGDYIFVGDPTADMEPLNDSARQLSAKAAARNANPVESLPTTLDADEAAFLGKLMAAAGPSPTVPKEDYDALLKRVAHLEAIAKDQSNVKRP